MSTPYEQAVEAGKAALLGAADKSADDGHAQLAALAASEVILTAVLPHLLAPIEALCEKMDGEAHDAAGASRCTGNNCGACTLARDASRLRAALASIKGQVS